MQAFYNGQPLRPPFNYLAHLSSQVLRPLNAPPLQDCSPPPTPHYSPALHHSQCCSSSLSSLDSCAPPPPPPPQLLPLALLSGKLAHVQAQEQQHAADTTPFPRYKWSLHISTNLRACWAFSHQLKTSVGGLGSCILIKVNTTSETVFLYKFLSMVVQGILLF
jgi:hypothetical protein